jgi:hypothetical protein
MSLWSWGLVSGGFCVGVAWALGVYLFVRTFFYSPRGMRDMGSNHE